LQCRKGNWPFGNSFDRPTSFAGRCPDQWDGIGPHQETGRRAIPIRSTPAANRMPFKLGTGFGPRHPLRRSGETTPPKFADRSFGMRLSNCQSPHGIATGHGFASNGPVPLAVKPAKRTIRHRSHRTMADLCDECGSRSSDKQEPLADQETPVNANRLCEPQCGDLPHRIIWSVVTKSRTRRPTAIA